MDGSSTGGAGADASATACSCADDGTTSWDCYCSVSHCETTLDNYIRDGGDSPFVVAYVEYASCNLAVVTTQASPDPPLQHAFELSTGRLVGEEKGQDLPTFCPFGSRDKWVWTLRAGFFGDATCVQSKCVSGLSRSYCPDAGI